LAKGNSKRYYSYAGSTLPRNRLKVFTKNGKDAFEVVLSPLINSARSPRTNIHLLPRARFHPGPGISSRRIVGRVLLALCDERMLVPLAANQECLQAQGLKKK